MKIHIFKNYKINTNYGTKKNYNFIFIAVVFNRNYVSKLNYVT